MNRLHLQLPAFTAIRIVFNTMYRMIYPFLPVFARGLGVDVKTISYALTARSVVGTFGPFSASVADRRGRKFGMLLGAALFTLGAVLVIFWPTFPALAISLCLTTLGKYVFDPAMQAYLGDQVPYERRGLAIAVTEMGWSFAFIAGIPLMGFMIARKGWMAPFPLLTALGGLIFIGLFFKLPKDKNPISENISLRSNFRAVISSVPALMGLAIGLLATIANEIVNLNLGIWLEDSFGLKIAALGTAAAIIGLSELSGEGLVAAFVDRFGKPRAIRIGLISNSLAALCLSLLGQTESGALAGLFLFYLTFEFTLVSIIPMMTEILPGARATVMAFNISALSLGRAIGAPLATLLYQFGFPAVTLGAVLFNMLALLALLRMHPHHHRVTA